MNRCEEEKGALEEEVGGAPGRGEDGEPTWISRLAFSSPPCVVVVSVA